MSIEQHFSPAQVARLLPVDRATIARAMRAWRVSGGREGLGPMSEVKGKGGTDSHVDETPANGGGAAARPGVVEVAQVAQVAQAIDSASIGSARNVLPLNSGAARVVAGVVAARLGARGEAVEGWGGVAVCAWGGVETPMQHTRPSFGRKGVV